MLGSPQRFGAPRCRFGGQRRPRKSSSRLPYSPPKFDVQGKLISAPAHFKLQSVKYSPRPKLQSAQYSPRPELQSAQYSPRFKLNSAQYSPRPKLQSEQFIPRPKLQSGQYSPRFNLQPPTYSSRINAKPQQYSAQLSGPPEAKCRDDMMDFPDSGSPESKCRGDMMDCPDSGSPESKCRGDMEDFPDSGSPKSKCRGDMVDLPENVSPESKCRGDMEDFPERLKTPRDLVESGHGRLNKTNPQEFSTRPEHYFPQDARLSQSGHFDNTDNRSRACQDVTCDQPSKYRIMNQRCEKRTREQEVKRYLPCKIPARGFIKDGHYRRDSDVPSERMEQPKRDFFLDSLPSNISEDDIRNSLRDYNIGVRRVNIRERTQDHTRFGFVSVYNEEEFAQLSTIRELTIKGHKVSIKVSKEKNKDDEDKYYKANISVLLCKAADLGINMAEILSTPVSARYLDNAVPPASCVTFHAVKRDYDQVRISNSLRVDPTTNTASDMYKVQKDPFIEAKFDDISQKNIPLKNIKSHYCSLGLASSNLPQNFTQTSDSEADLPTLPNSEAPDGNLVLKSLHLDRTTRKMGGSQSSLNDLSRSKTSAENYNAPLCDVNPTSSYKPFSFKPPPHLNPPRDHVTNSDTAPTPPFTFGGKPDILHPSFEDSAAFSQLPPRNKSCESKSEKLCKFTASPLSLGVIDITPTFPHVTPLVLRPLASFPVTPFVLGTTVWSKKADIPYDFRYLVPDPDILDVWFEEPLNNGSGSPMSVEEEFSEVTDAQLSDSSEYQLSDEIETLKLEENAENLQDSPIDTNFPNPTSSLQLLQLFKPELEAMCESKDYAEFEGVSLQVSHLFQDLLQQDLISQTDIDKDCRSLSEKIQDTETKVTEIQETIDSLSPDEELDLIEELENDHLSVANDTLREQKTDLLLLQILNILDGNAQF